MSARITNVRIIYNQHNIDSAMAAAYLSTILRKADDKYFGSKDCAPLVISTQHYDCTRHTPVKGKVDVLYVLGTTLLGSDLLAEVDACQPEEVIEFHYRPSAVKFSAANIPLKYMEVTPYNIDALSSDDAGPADTEELISEASVSVLVAKYLEDLWVESSQFKTDELKLLIKAAGHYINFRRFDRFFKFEDQKDSDYSNVTPNNKCDGSAEDLAYLYKHFNRIKYSAANAVPLEVSDDYEFDTKHFTSHVSVARNIIHRNMSQISYNNKTKYVIIPTVCVGEESAIEVMRQLSYPYKTVITYEDVRNQRIWRIYTASTTEVLDLLRTVIKPTEEWSECQIHYMVTEVPKFDRS